MNKINEKTGPEEKECDLTRRNFLKVPVISTGFMLGAMIIPPFTEIAIAATSEFDMNIEGLVKVGLWKTTLPIPSFIINQVVDAGIKQTKKKARQFTEEKRALHHFIVRELPAKGEPLSLEFIAKGLGMPLDKVTVLVDELEQGKTFLYRRNSKRINWAYPVSVDDTPHHVTFSTGEQINAA